MSESAVSVSDSSVNIPKPGDVHSNISPIRKHLIRKYLTHDDEDSLPFFGEYFSVALAFLAIGSLLRRMNEKKSRIQSRMRHKQQRMALEGMIRAAMERLRDVAQRAYYLDQKRAADMMHWHKKYEIEKSKLLDRLAEAEGAILELNRKRSEDAKANEKVMVIVSSQQQFWKNEKDELLQEIEILQRKVKVQNEGNDAICENCKRRERTIFDLEEKLIGKEFREVAAMNEAKMEHHQKIELIDRLEAAEAVITSLRKGMIREVTERNDESRNHFLQIADLLARLQRSENKGRILAEKIEAEVHSRKKLAQINDDLSSEVIKLQQELDSQAEVLSAMLRQSEYARELNCSLEKELKEIKFKCLTYEQRMEEHACNNRNAEEPNREILMQRWDPQRSVTQTLLSEQIKVLENQVNHYQEKVQQLENSILSAVDQDQKLKGKRSVSKEMVVLQEPLEVEVAIKEQKLSTTKDLLVQYMNSEHARELELNKWRKLYLAAKSTIGALQKENSLSEILPVSSNDMQVFEFHKARNAAKLEQRHWQEIHSFERHIKAQGERLESLRLHLLDIQAENDKNLSDVEALTLNLKQMTEEKLKAEIKFEKAHQELTLYRGMGGMQHISSSNIKLKGLEGNGRTLSIGELASDLHAKAHEAQLLDALRKAEIELQNKDHKVTELEAKISQMQEKMEDLTTRVDLKWQEEGKQVTADALEKAEAELHEKDLRLASMEAKLFQARIQLEKDRNAHSRSISELQKEKTMVENLLRNSFIGAQESSIQNVIDAACFEVERLSDMISEASEQMTLLEKPQAEPLNEFLEQAVEVSKSGKNLRKIKDLLAPVIVDGLGKTSSMPTPDSITEALLEEEYNQTLGRLGMT